MNLGGTENIVIPIPTALVLREVRIEGMGIHATMELHPQNRFTPNPAVIHYQGHLSVKARELLKQIAEDIAKHIEEGNE